MNKTLTAVAASLLMTTAGIAADAAARNCLFMTSSFESKRAACRRHWPCCR